MVVVHPLPPPGPSPYGPRPTEPFAIAALATGLSGMSAVPLTLGLVALHRIRRTGDGGRGLAIAGVVLGGLQLLLVVTLVTAFTVGAAITVVGLARESTSATTAEAETIPIVDLVAGDCFDHGGLEEVRVIDCADAHDAEVVQVLTLTDTGTYPGADAVEAEADERCFAAVGAALDEAGVPTDVLDYDYFVPLRETWEDGERDVECLLIGTDDRSISGSVLDGTLEVPAEVGPAV